MAIGEICSREVIFAPTDMTVRAAAQLMREYHVGALVVVKDPEGARTPVGIITDRDIVVAIVAKGLNAELLRVDEVMGPELATVRETDGVSATIALMRAKGVRRMPVLDAAGRLAGIVTADDFLDLLAEELSALARLVTHEQRREAQVRSV